MDPSESGSFASAEGLSLYYELFRPAAEARAAIVLAHGYTDHTGRQHWLMEQLVRDGYAALGFDFRGHGRSEGARGHCVRFEDYVQDLASALTLARQKIGDASGADSPLPIVVLGESHGALVALRLLCEVGRTPTGVRAAVFCSPYLGLAKPVPPLMGALARLASRVAPALALPNGLDSRDFSHNAEAAASYNADPLVHRVATARWFVESTAAQRWVLDHAADLALPTLWLAAGEDCVVSLAAAVRVYEHAGGEKKLRLYRELYHELWNEPERLRVLNDLLTWLAQRQL